MPPGETAYDRSLRGHMHKLHASSSGERPRFGVRYVWVDDGRGRLSYATAMRQIHTGVIPGLYTYTVEEGMNKPSFESLPLWKRQKAKKAIGLF